MVTELKETIHSEIDARELRRVITEVIRQRKNASEYNGLAGQAMKQAIDEYALDRVALAYVIRLSKMEPDRLGAALRATIRYAYLAGLFDQYDAFHPFADELQIILDAIRATQPETPRDGVMLQLIG